MESGEHKVKHVARERGVLGRSHRIGDVCVVIFSGCDTLHVMGHLCN